MSAAPKSSTPLFFLLFIIGVMAMLFLSVQSLYQGYTFYQEGLLDQATYQFLIGVVGLVTSTYIIIQFRSRMIKISTPATAIVTTTECRSCGFKSIRKFMKGDYVLKSAENCPQCNEPMTITSIYPEEKEKKEESS